MLVCPACRTRTPDMNAGGHRLDLRTLERAGDGDLLVCTCGGRYPIVDGVPLVFADPSAYLRDDVMLFDRDVSSDVATLLVEGGPDTAPFARVLEVMSVYMDAHWGDRATPPPDGSVDASALWAKLDARRSAPVARAVELGCCTGRGLAALAAGAELVVGLDIKHAALRRARRMLAGERVPYARRIVGRRYAPATAHAPDVATLADRVALVCADALDPPLVPGWCDRVVALNLLDNVAQPRQLLAVIDGLCAPGGEIILSSPYAWLSGTTLEDERIGGDDPAAELVRLLGDRYTIEDEDELTWTLRRERRWSVNYRVHYVRARKR
jgi:SAM-dependent methyltransferase